MVGQFGKELRALVRNSGGSTEEGVGRMKGGGGGGVSLVHTHTPGSPMGAETAKSTRIERSWRELRKAGILARGGRGCGCRCLCHLPPDSSVCYEKLNSELVVVDTA